MALLKEMLMSKPKFSNFDLSRSNKFSASIGRIYPVLVEECLPGDTMNIRCTNDVKTSPMTSPFMGSFKQQLTFFFVPSRLYSQTLDQNNNLSYQTTGTSAVGASAGGNLMTSNYNSKFPVFTISKVLGGTTSNPWRSTIPYVGPVCRGTLLDFLGIPAGTTSNVSASAGARWFNAIPLIGYFDIFRNYYANTQELTFPILRRDYCTSAGYCQEYYSSVYTNASYSSGVWSAMLAQESVSMLSLASLDTFIRQFTLTDGLDFTKAWQTAFTGTYNLVSATPTSAVQLKASFGSPSVWNGSTWSSTPSGISDSNPVFNATRWLGIAPSDSSYAQRYGTSSSLNLMAVSNDWGQFVPFNGAGLLFCTHNSDMLTAYLSSSQYETLVTQNSVGVDDGYFTVNQLRVANHMQKAYERSIVSGGRYDDWVYAQFGIRTNKNLCIPELLGCISSQILFDDVTATNFDYDGSNSPYGGGDGLNEASSLGVQGGKGYGSLNSRNIHFTASEHGYIMALYTIKPNVSYSSRTNPLYTKIQLQDLYQPQLQNIGFQPLMKYNYSSQPTWTATSFYSPFPDSQNLSSNNPFGLGIGYQPAYTEYMTALNESHGRFNQFLGDLPYWVNNRGFQTYQLASTSVASNGSANIPVSTGSSIFYGSSGTDTTSPVGASPTYASLVATGMSVYGQYGSSFQLSTYGNYSRSIIDTSFSATSYVRDWQFQFPFVYQNVDNFFINFYFDFKARRPISKSLMPTL